MVNRKKTKKWKPKHKPKLKKHDVLKAEETDNFHHRSLKDLVYKTVRLFSTSFKLGVSLRNSKCSTYS